MRIVYLAIAVGIVLLALSLMQNNPSFNESKWYSFKKGEEVARESGKKMFVFIASPTCPKCIEFKHFFENESVMKYISENFVPVYVDVTRERPIQVFVVPTFCVGFPDNLTCFTASSGSELMNMLAEMAQ